MFVGSDCDNYEKLCGSCARDVLSITLLAEIIANDRCMICTNEYSLEVTNTVVCY